MDKKEFDSSFDLIKEIISSTSKASETINQNLKEVTADVTEYIKSMNDRDNSLKNYIQLLSEFDYADKLNSPTDMFPGIKTAKDMSDPEQLKAKADSMKDAAFKVKASHERNELLTNSVSQSIRALFGLIKEYDAKETQAYELAMDLLSKSDSIYDIGGLVK